MLRKKNSRRGFTLTEAAIALAVIAIVSMASISIVISSADIERDTILTASVINDAENVVDCFDAADTVKDLRSILLNESGTGPSLGWKAVAGRPGEFRLERETYIVKLSIVIKGNDQNLAEEQYLNQELAMVYFEAIDRSGDIIYAFDYKK